MKIIEAFILYYRVKALSLYLRSKGIYCTINAHFRDKKTAHKWSTAYSIITGKVQLGALRSLDKGYDLDGNRWYEVAWDTGGSDEIPAKNCSAIKENALALYGPDKIVFAAEGYESGTARRKPNVNDIPVSKHVYGAAIDINLHWDRIGGPWSGKARRLMSDFGLLRPVSNECWHVELNKKKSPRYLPYEILWFWLKSRRKSMSNHLN